MITDLTLLTVGYYLEFYPTSRDIYLLHIDSVDSDGVTMTEIYPINSTESFSYAQLKNLRYLPTSCTTWADVQSTYPELFL